MFCRTCDKIRTCKKICKDLNKYLVKGCPPQREVLVGSSFNLEYIEGKIHHNPCGGGKRKRATNWEKPNDL